MNIEKYGVPSNAMFVDIDNDKDLDLFITYAFGSPILLENQLSQTGTADFKEVTKEKGLDVYTNSISANFLDINKDGRLDVIIGNGCLRIFQTTLKISLKGLTYSSFLMLSTRVTSECTTLCTLLGMADNGGVNDIFLQDENGVFVQQDSKEMGMPEHFLTLAIATGDLNKDGYTDVYVANDFGPDNLYYNIEGKRFEKIEGKIFGSIGKDTYKGMNATIADVDGNGWQDVYVSNVHHELSREGSLLWMFEEGKILIAH